MSANETVELVTLKIDGKEVSVPKGTMIIRAAEQVGVRIPRFCDHPLLKPAGACRQCLVEVARPGRDGTLAKMPKPAASCAEAVSPGHGGLYPEHIRCVPQGPAWNHGVPAHQPSDGLPGL